MSVRKPRWVDAFLVIALALNLALLAAKLGDLRLPGDDTGYAPVQPIAFSHRLHGGELQIPCLYCHPAAARARYAGTPAPNLCMNCHRFISSTLGAVRAEEKEAQEEGRPVRRIVSTEIQKIYDALGLDGELRPSATGKPIEWIRVHRLPDFVRFHHGTHSLAEVDCRICHGQAEKMERVRQEYDLSMGWCVNCHRDYQGRSAAGRRLAASTDCGVCHY